MAPACAPGVHTKLIGPPAGTWPARRDPGAGAPPAGAAPGMQEDDDDEVATKAPLKRMLRLLCPSSWTELLRTEYEAVILFTIALVRLVEIRLSVNERRARSQRRFAPLIRSSALK